MQQLKLSLKERRNYFIFIIPTYIVGFILYTSLAAYAVDYQNFQSPIEPYVCGIMGGFLFAGIISGIIIFVSFIRKKPIWFKVICAVLFLPIAAIIFFVGMLTLIPYFLYSIWSVIRTWKKIKNLEDQINKTLDGQIIEQLMKNENKNVMYEEIKYELHQYNLSNVKVLIIAGFLIIGGIITASFETGLLLNLISYAAVIIGFLFLCEKRIHPLMNKGSDYCTGIFYMGCDENEYFGIFHEKNELIRKSLERCVFLKGSGINQINRFICNVNKEIILIYGIKK